MCVARSQGCAELQHSGHDLQGGGRPCPPPRPTLTTLRCPRPPTPRFVLPSPAGVEMFKKVLNEGQAGDNVGLLIRGLKRDDVERGQVVCKPGSIKPHRKFRGEIYALSKEEGGRHTPFFTNYKPQFFFRTADVTGAPLLRPAVSLLVRCGAVSYAFSALCCCRSCAGTVTLPEGTEMVMPGDNVTCTFELLCPGEIQRCCGVCASSRVWIGRRPAGEVAELPNFL